MIERKGREGGIERDRERGMKQGYLLDLFFLSWMQLGQYHLPLGFETRFTHWKWNHSI